MGSNPTFGDLFSINCLGHTKRGLSGLFLPLATNQIEPLCRPEHAVSKYGIFPTLVVFIVSTNMENPCFDLANLFLSMKEFHKPTFIKYYCDVGNHVRNHFFLLFSRKTQLCILQFSVECLVPVTFSYFLFNPNRDGFCSRKFQYNAARDYKDNNISISCSIAL